MTIDEAIKIIENLGEEGGCRFCQRDDRKEAKAIAIQALKELQWWRSQDLINRKDADVEAQPEVEAIAYEPSTKYQESFGQFFCMEVDKELDKLTIRKEKNEEVIRETQQAMSENEDCQWK